MHSFISASSAGQNWRTVIQKLLKDIAPKIDAANASPNLGFLYLTDKLARDSEGIVELLRSITGVTYWVGVTGAAVFSDSGVYADKPAASCLLMQMDEDDFSIIAMSEEGYFADMARLVDNYQDCGAATAHFYYHPDTGFKPEVALDELYNQTFSFFTGGLSSARGNHKVFTHNKRDDLLVGCCFSPNIEVVSVSSEGFVNVGEEHKITKCEKNIICELDNQNAASVLSDDLSKWLSEKQANDDFIGQDLDELMAYLPMLSGEMHMAFRYYRNDVAGRSIKNFAGRNNEHGWLAASHAAQEGEHVAFVFRDQASLKTDLAKKLMELRARLQAEGQLDRIKGGVYVSNVSRLNKDEPDIELTLIKEIIGDVPIAGFYSSGEISHHSLYSFTGVLTLFL